MATAILRPNADVSNAWAITDGGSTAAWQVLDDAVTQPTAPGTASDFVSENIAGNVSQVDVETVQAASVSAAKLWIYCATTAITPTMTFELLTGTTRLAGPTTVSAGTTAGWQSVTYTGSLTQAQVDALRIKLVKGGVTGTSTAYAAYVELTYVAPVILSFSPTGIASAEAIGSPAIFGELRRYDVRLGRIALSSVKNDLTEALGESLDVVGSGITAGERRPRPLELTIPVYGDPAETDPYAVSLRMRRQLRSLIDNPDARLAGIYFRWDIDSEQSGWLLVGEAEITYSEGGITLSDFELSLSDCYRVGLLRTHRPARRLIAIDRRVSTAFRDTYKTISGTWWASLLSTAQHFLPVGASDVEGAQRTTPTLTAVPTSNGDLQMVSGRSNGEVLSFEQAEADYGKAAADIYDRRGSAVIPTNPADDIQKLYGWEEVYGANYPFSTSDLPVLDNGLARVRWDSTQKVLIVDRIFAAAWVERGRISLWSAVATLQKLNEIVSVSVIEWTAERLVVSATLRRTADTNDRVEVVLTLQRGWRGPRVEIYAGTYPGGSGKPGLAIRWTPNSTAAQTITTANNTYTVFPTDTGAWSVQTKNWARISEGDTDKAAVVAVMRNGVRLWARSDTDSFPSGTRNALELEARLGSAEAGYVSAHIALGHPTPTDFGEISLCDARAVPELVTRA